MLAVSFMQSGLKIGRQMGRHLPSWPQQWVLCLCLNRLLRAERHAGDFDFLAGKTLSIDVEDFSLTYCITLNQRRFVPGTARADATIAAELTDLLKIIIGEADPDSLFFQRRLRISGDTELGLTAKNTLDAIDRHQLPRSLLLRLSQLTQLIELAENQHKESSRGAGMPGR
ncbi:ubiquinone anaerobic biosynthesis accessory factor UbiT [Simiduia agarivorans]|uniref:Ubiquinone biosynthesis accessory factor UbiT n=1 Tax=Simiduia agarivorans (strain DSM 21679 / JCM 13881 / BCRC 17597 / SA1) TaxID=1117647 RepID=K4L1X9_SIMAS|nr:SCP2 sterol-binding domain-containing protein [Simiduia agarivorans]AFV00148.2 Sterol-binding domain-containing protein [Simiduia agarivorans SA1 = DSM 21679]